MAGTVVVVGAVVVVVGAVVVVELVVVLVDAVVVLAGGGTVVVVVVVLEVVVVGGGSTAETGRGATGGEPAPVPPLLAHASVPLASTKAAAKPAVAAAWPKARLRLRCRRDVGTSAHSPRPTRATLSSDRALWRAP